MNTLQSPITAYGSRTRIMLILACAMALVAAMWLGGPITKANATVEQFCSGYLAAPYGQNGDRCHAPAYHILNGVTGKGVNHSACVDAEEGTSLITSWVCSSGPEVEVSLGTCCGRTLRGVVRNNTTGDTNKLWGWDFF
jgi:hypothetical protein